MSALKSSGRISCAIVDSDELARRALWAMVSGEEDLECVGSFGSAEEVLESVPDKRPQVILMDLQLSGVSAIRCIHALSIFDPKPRVIVLSTHLNPEVIFNSLRAGAFGYLLKPFRCGELLGAIRGGLKACSPITAAVARRVLEVLGEPSRSGSEQPFRLSSQEQKKLELLREGLSYDEAAKVLSLGLQEFSMSLERSLEKLQLYSWNEAAGKAGASRIRL